MVQLKSFKYVEQDQADECLAQGGCSAPAPSSARSSISVSTVVGGNLTASSDSQSMQVDDKQLARDDRQSTLSSNEEYQSAVHDMSPDDAEDEHDGRLSQSKSGANPEQGRLEDIAKQRAAAAASKAGDDAAVTRLNIERGSITNLPDAAASQPLAGVQQVLKFQLGDAQRAHRLQHLTRAQTSPALSLLLAGGSPKAGSPSPGPIVRSPLAGWPAAIKRNQSGDSMSQYSFSTQKNYSNHFEIRWHNVRLFARRDKRLPKIITDNALYQYIVCGGGGCGDEAASMRTDCCHSPPMQHRNIPPPIDETHELEGLEMRACAQTPTTKRQRLDACKSQTADEQQRTERHILNNISGQVFSGQMTAVLGPSGVGKTTLLNSLTGRNSLDGSGRVSLIGATTRKRMSVVTVPQNDVLPGKLTTLEDLRFTSRLKNPQTKFDHMRNIDRIVKHLHMEKFLYTRIDKLSGGEKRRLSIARELLASPDIMILDEPTSGLDANTCKKIITALRDIVEHGDNILDKPMSIIVTIHQPQQEVYNLFHRVYVMAVGGRAIYEGPPTLLLPTLLEHSSLAKATQADQLNENPAIVAIEVASGEYGPHIIDELANYHEDQVYEEFSIMGNFAQNSQFGDDPLIGGGATNSPIQTPHMLRTPRRSPMSMSRFDIAPHHRKRLNSLGDSSIGRPTPIMAKRQFVPPSQMDRISTMTSLSYASTYDADLPNVTSKLKVDKRLRRSVVMKSHLSSNTWTLMQRCWLLATRDMFLMSIRILGFLLVAGGTVQIFAHALDPDQHLCPLFESRANSEYMFFFHILLCITMVTSALAGLVFPMQMRMFVREYKNGWYSPASFILSQTLAELPVDIIGPMITLLITYPLCHQPTSMYYWREIGYILVAVGCSIICKSQAQIVGAFLMDSVENSVFISCVCVVGPALLSGIPVRIAQMSTPLQIISYGSFLRYGFESLMALRYGYGMCPCDTEIVFGYPLNVSSEAVPESLKNLARGIIDLNQPINYTTTTKENTMSDSSSRSSFVGESINDEHENIILKFIRLITDAGNMMLPNAPELGNCDNYRSLHMMSNNVPNDILPKWLTIMAIMFVASRILTYFVVKTVIRFRRS